MTNPIRKLQNLAITTACSVHDEEALTSLELAGRTAAKVNECVKLVNDTCEKLDTNLANTLTEVLKEVLPAIIVTLYDDENITTEAIALVIDEIMEARY